MVEVERRDYLLKDRASIVQAADASMAGVRQLDTGTDSDSLQ